MLFSKRRARIPCCWLAAAAAAVHRGLVLLCPAEGVLQDVPSSLLDGAALSNAVKAGFRRVLSG